jgi:hypothetical protein
MEGRDFNDDDLGNLVPMLDALEKDKTGSAPLPPILVNATMAARYWPKGDAIGQVVLVGGENGWRIVGVVGDVKQKEATAPAPAHVYLPLGTPLPPRPFTLMVRSALPARDLVAGVRGVLAKVDKDVPPDQVRSMDEVIASAFDGARFQTFVLLAFASAALVLALVGIYGVISYWPADARSAFAWRRAPRESTFSGSSWVAWGSSRRSGSSSAARRLWCSRRPSSRFSMKPGPWTRASISGSASSSCSPPRWGARSPLDGPPTWTRQSPCGRTDGEAAWISDILDA